MMVKIYKRGDFQNPVVMVHDGYYAVMLCDGKSQKCQFSSLHTPNIFGKVTFFKHSLVVVSAKV